MSIHTIEQLKALYRQHGVTTVYVKPLSNKQGNDKNQIYLGSGMGGVLNLFAAEVLARSPSDSKGKRNSETGRPKLEAKIDLAWMGENGQLSPGHCQTKCTGLRSSPLRLGFGQQRAIVQEKQAWATAAAGIYPICNEPYTVKVHLV